MFITLKSSSQRNGDASMEQVASRNAGPNAHVSRASSSRWRAPCIACQSKRLRCTGRLRDCDRCTTRGQICIYPAFQAGPSRKNRRAAPGSQSATQEGVEGDRIGIRKDGADSRAREGAAATSVVVAHAQTDFGHVVDFSAFSAENGGHNDGIYYQHQHQLPNIEAGVLSTLNLDDFGMAAAMSALAGSSPGSTSTPPQSSSSQPCQCAENTIRIVQQLESDEFHLTTLPMDEVIQLKRWLVTECRTAIQCSACNSLATARTMVLIICDRLSEMFECIHRRIQRVNQRISNEAMAALPSGGFYAALTPDSTDDGTNTSSPPQQQERRQNSTPQLFCSITEGASGKAPCNPMLFQAHLHSTYSDEQQIHMISALLRLQVDDMKDLLDRLQGAAQISANPANVAKVKSFQVRVAQAADDIEAALASSLRLFAAARR